MHLYHLTLVLSTSVSHVITGSFTGPGRAEVAKLSPSHLTLYRILDKSGELHPLFSTPLFANARALARFRLPGDRTDFAIVTSDAGSLTVLRAVEGKGWESVACEFFGKSGVRRTVPGEFLAVDPRGRACMIAAVEKGRIAYVLNRDEEGALAVSSPLIRPKSAMSTFWIVGLDVGFENPMFAVLEKGYERESKKLLVYYELDLGLNHVVRKYAAEVADSTYVMLAVPGGNDGPGGVLLCEDGFVTYRNILTEEDESSSEPMQIDRTSGVGGSYRSIKARYRGALPHRDGVDPHEAMIVTSAMHKYKSVFFFILCTDAGDLIKCSLAWEPETGVKSLTLRYFDSLPGPASSMVILRAGYLFAAMESGDHLLLKFKGVGDGYDPAGGYSSTNPVSLFAVLSPAAEKTAANGVAEQPDADTMTRAVKSKLSFVWRKSFKNLRKSDTCDSMSQAVSFACGYFTSHEASQLLVGCGGQESSLKVLRRGFSVALMVEQDLRATVTNVFTLKTSPEDVHDKFIVISFVNRTKIFHVGASTVSEVTETKFVTDSRTLGAAQMGAKSMAQIYPGGIRFVTGDTFNDWNPSKGVTILSGAMNASQIVLTLSNGSVLYFEIEASGGSALVLRETLDEAVTVADPSETQKSGLPSYKGPVVTISDIPRGRTKGSFVAVADGSSSTARIYRVDTNSSSLSEAGLQVAPGPVSSLAIVDFRASSATSTEQNLMLLLGTRTGGLTMAELEPTTGNLSGKRSRVLGSKAVTLIPLKLGGTSTCIATSSKPFLLHRTPSGLSSSPIECEGVAQAASFSSEKLPNGFIYGHGKKLVIAYLDALHNIAAAASAPSSTSSLMLPPPVSLNSQFCLSSSETAATPRRIVSLGRKSPYFLLVQSSQKSTISPKWLSKLSLVTICPEDAGVDEDEDVDGALPSFRALQDISFAPSVALTGACVVSMNSVDYVAVCTTESLVVSATSDKSESVNTTPSYAIRIYRVQKANENNEEMSLNKSRNDANRKMELVPFHSTKIEEPIVAIAGFQDRLLVGVGSTLRMYEIGKKQLLRKGEQKKAVANRITQICVSRGDRVWLGDTKESAALLQIEIGKGGSGLYKKTAFKLVADDTLPRWVVAMTVLDYSSVAVSDKFGNIAILRVPPEIDSATAAATAVGASFPSAECKLVVEACIHVGSIVTGLSITDLRPLASKYGDSSLDDGVIVYTTIDGAIGVLSPFKIRSEGMVLEALEREMRERTRGKSIIGRDYLAWRGSFFPLKRIVDGDLCELWATVPWEEKVSIAKRLDRDAADLDRILCRYRDGILC